MTSKPLKPADVVADAINTLSATVARSVEKLTTPPLAPAVDTGQWRKPCRLPVLARALPGFAALWVQRVPEEYVDREQDGRVFVRSPCGERVECPDETVVYCPDDCGRWLLSLPAYEDKPASVRVKKWPRDE